MTSASEPGFRLTIEQRAALRLGIDPAALEALLSAIPAAGRPLVLRAYTRPKPGENEIFLGQPDDPALQALMRKVVPSGRVAPRGVDRERLADEHRALHTPVRIALVPSPGTLDASAVVRRSGDDPQATILVAEGLASPSLLDAALYALFTDEGEVGHRLTAERRILVHRQASSSPVPAGSAAAGHLAYLGALLDGIRETDPQEIEGIGPARVGYFHRAR